jgi:hypothetical protein
MVSTPMMPTMISSGTPYLCWRRGCSPVALPEGDAGLDPHGVDEAAAVALPGANGDRVAGWRDRLDHRGQVLGTAKDEGQGVLVEAMALMHFVDELLGFRSVGIAVCRVGVTQEGKGGEQGNGTGEGRRVEILIGDGKP